MGWARGAGTFWTYKFSGGGGCGCDAMGWARGAGASGLTNSAAAGAGAAGVTQWVGHGGRGPSTLRVQAFGGLERDRSASENGPIALSDV